MKKLDRRERFKAWLDNQPSEVSIWIASRAAARVLPLWWDAVLTEDWARERDLTALPVLRSLLISSVAAVVPTDDIRFAAYASDAAYAAADANANSNAADAAYAAADAANTAYAAAGSAAESAYAAFAAADAAAVAAYAAAAWDALGMDAEHVAGDTFPAAMPLWPERSGPLAKEWTDIKAQLGKSSDLPDWQFWIEWYDALLAGCIMLSDPKRTWDMLEEIAVIDPETWDAGPEVVNPVIREIWEGYKDGSSSAGHAADPEPVSENAKSAMKQRVAVNRDALVVASAGIIDQLGAYREQVRGMNHLEPDLRDEVLAFIDEFTGKLSALIQGLPASGTVNDAQAGRLVLWLREYRGLLNHKLAYYGSAENMAEATVPTGIILGATGIGAMLGMPVAGSVVGGLLVNQMKPGQAAKELTKPQDKDVDPQ